MTKEFIPYEIALDMKSIGFDEPCFAKYTVIPEDKIDWFTIPEQGITDKTSFGSSKNYNSKSFEEEGTISAPTFSQCFRWFREKYELVVDWNYSQHDNFGSYIGVCIKNIHLEETIVGVYKTYEEAELECLKKIIEITKNK
jgi:hypothetical protein